MPKKNLVRPSFRRWSHASWFFG